MINVAVSYKVGCPKRVAALVFAWYVWLVLKRVLGGVLEFLYKFCATVGAFLSIGAFLDKFALDIDRQRVAFFIFVSRNADFSSFERGVFRSLISIFEKEIGKLSYIRICAFTFFVGFVGFYLVTVLDPAGYNSQFDLSDLEILLALLIGGLSMAIVSFPFDLWSFSVTKYIFRTEVSGFIRATMLVLVDSLLSIIPYLGVLALFVIYTPADEGTFLYFASGAMIPSLVTTLAFGFFQLIVLLFGICTRAFVQFTRFNEFISLHSKFYNYPFSYVFFLFGNLVFVFYLIVHSRFL